MPPRSAETSSETLTPNITLLAVTGMSPAILTETLWALAHPADGNPPILPNRIILVTTSTGRDHALRLFQPDPHLGGVTPWDALRAALQAEGHDLKGRLRFGPTPQDIRVFTTSDPTTGLSTEMSDLRTPTDNEAAADFLLEQVRSLTENPDIQLIASLAGGRKTMGALLYACLTLLGRDSDLLSHVLVSEPFETLPGFWFPTQPGPPLSTRQGSSLHPTEAKIQLATVPFVPLRNLFARDLGRLPGSFTHLIASCGAEVRRRAAETLRITLDTTRRQLHINQHAFPLTPLELLVLLFLAHRAKDGAPPFASYKDAADPLNAFQQQLCASVDPATHWSADLSPGPYDDDTIAKSMSRLRGKLPRAHPDIAPFADALPTRGRCSLDLPPGMIFIH